MIKDIEQLLMQAYMQGVHDANNGGGNEDRAKIVASALLYGLCAKHSDELAYRKTQAAGALSMIEALYREVAGHMKGNGHKHD